ncbi:MAG: hypothetical protein PVJ11_13535 [Syntrophobacterales bacterium]|jgi:hypothetical protein
MELLKYFMSFSGFRKKSTRIYLALFFFLAVNLSWPRAKAHGETFVGKAVNAQGIVEYVEYHTVKYENGKVGESQTIYYDGNNKKIGELTSEYSFGPQFGSYDFRDIRAQYQDGAKVSGDKILLFRKKSPEDDVEEVYLAKEKDQIVGQGFHQFIVHNLERIAQGEVIHIRLVLPSRLDQYEFRIRKRKVDGNTLYIRLEIDNWLLRLFAPHIDVEYDLRTRHLLRYEGVSNLEDNSGKHKKVIITYSYKS